MTKPSTSPKTIRVLHTADWHLGKRLERFSRLQEQREVLEEICDIAEQEQVDVVLIAGDIFDTFNPPVEAVEMFYKYAKRLANNGRCPVVAIAGNHDSPDRFETPEPLARECGILLLGYPNSETPRFQLESGLQILDTEPGFIELKLPDKKAPLRIVTTPYANENRLRTCLGFEDVESEMRDLLEKHWTSLAEKKCDSVGVNLLMAHLFMLPPGAEAPKEADDEKPILHVGGAQVVFSSSIPKTIQYVALGHIHGRKKVSSNPPAWYSGSPLSYSMSEAGQQKFVSIVDCEPGKKVKLKEVPLTAGKPCLRMSFDSIEDAVRWLETSPNSLVELTIRSDTYLKAEDRQALTMAHDGIVAIIPELSTDPTETSDRKKAINLERNTEELFIDYFESRFEQKPSSDLLGLLGEVLAEDDE
ncbi:MAG: metallophosphoesterase family protein [Calditrichia bacterium]